MDRPSMLFVQFRERGDLQALGEVFDQLAPRLLPVALHLCGHPADAEDAVQQTFLIAIQRAAAFDRGQRLEPWLAGVLTNVARNQRRQRQRRRAVAMPDVASDDEGPGDAALRRELVAHLRAHVDALPGEQRQALLMQLHHGLAPAEIAELLGVPAGTVRMRIHRGLQALRHLLPAGLAALAVAGFTTRGVAAVRAAVLHGAAERVAATAAAAACGSTIADLATHLGGSLAMKKILVSIAALLVAIVAWRTLAAPLEPPPHTTARHDMPAQPAGAGPDHREHGEPEIVTDDAAVARLPTTGVLRIRTLAIVDDHEDLPLAGVFVVVWSGDSACEPFDGTALQRRTDDLGQLELPALAPGTWQARIPADRDEVRSIEIVAGGTAELVFRRPARTMLRGMVVDANRRPVPGADLWVLRGTHLGRYSLPEPGEIASRLAGRSDAGGRFVVAIADLYESRITASHPGYGESRGRYCNSVHGEFELVLGPQEAQLSGTVRDSAGTPIAGALVTVQTGGNDSRRAANGTLLAGRVPRHQESDRDGRFRFLGLAPGEVSLGASAYPHGPHGQTIELRGGDAVEVDLELPDGVSIVGSVRHEDGTPARGMVESRPSRDTDGYFSQC
ncbi:MAG: sigma-70 family RNA polymerase sigma factor, partial [Planctomycetes bacterium]|nr:sigma-70 family RNA polymerase sigma factor [Planctomycetota bacterium]